MAEYIEREALMEYPIRINHYDKEHGKLDFVLGIESVLEYAEALPAADVVEVKHGRWDVVIEHEEFWGDIDYYKCSLCGKMELRDSQTPYCPNCGARMDGE